MGCLLTLTLAVFSCITPGITVQRSIIFSQYCGGYLKQAADASSISTALDRLNLAIEYIEENNLTEGYTSIIYKTQDEDLRFWYHNILDAREQLTLSLNGSKLEQDNALMRVREALTDNGEEGTKVTIPDGISRYPHNTIFAILNSISILLLCIIFFIITDS